MPKVYLNTNHLSNNFMEGGGGGGGGVDSCGNVEFKKIQGTLQGAKSDKGNHSLCLLSSPFV